MTDKDCPSPNFSSLVQTLADDQMRPFAVSIEFKFNKT